MLRSLTNTLSRRAFLRTQSAAVVGASCVMMGSTCGDQQPMTRLDCQLGYGVTLAGPEFGTHDPGFSNERPGRPGKDYTYNSERTVQYFASRNARLLRIPFRWERIQPRLGESLDVAEVDRLKTAIDWAAKSQCQVVLDLHNYARYTLVRDGQPFEAIIDRPWRGKTSLTRAHFADVWRRLAQEFHDVPGVAAYGLMNEPHDMGGADWKAISQLAVTEIRKVDRNTRLLVAGDGWSNAHRWADVNGPKAWITDPSNRTSYEAHCYFDHDFSGEYKLSFDDELDGDPNLDRRAETRALPFLDWCRTNNVCGFLGEFGVPGNDARWVAMLDNLMTLLKERKVGGCYWAGGEWWNDYALSVQPRDGFDKTAPQLASITR